MVAVDDAFNIVLSELHSSSLGGGGSEEQLLEDLGLVDALDLEVGSNPVVGSSSTPLTSVLDADSPDAEPSLEPTLREDDVGDEGQQDVLLGLIDSEARAASRRRVLVDNVLARDVESSRSQVLSRNVAKDREPDQHEKTQSVGQDHHQRDAEERPGAITNVGVLELPERRAIQH